MFGNDGYQQGQQTGAPQPTTDLPADGTLAAPTMDSGPLTMPTDDGMPPFEPTSAGDAPASGGRQMQAHTPEELIGIKQEALQTLKPLIGHLDQNADEKFRTVMMMIQASDDQSMIPEAYEAAKAIQDEKARAQALLDVVNEINYFTTQNQSTTAQT